MAKVRLYIVEPPGSPNCPPGLNGCVNSGLYDPTQFSGGCGDGRQFANLNDLLNYANSNGEQTRSVSNAAEAAAICSQGAIPLSQPTIPTGCPGGICGPSSPSGSVSGAGGTIPYTTTGGPTAPTNPSQVIVTGPQTIAPPQTLTSGGGSSSPGGGQLPGAILQSGPATTGVTQPGGTPLGAPATTAVATMAGFDFGAFFKSPLAILALVVVIIIAISRKG